MSMRAQFCTDCGALMPSMSIICEVCMDRSLLAAQGKQIDLKGFSDSFNNGFNAGLMEAARIARETADQFAIGDTAGNLEQDAGYSIASAIEARAKDLKQGGANE